MKETISPGDKLPVFSLLNQKGEWVSPSNLIGEKAMVIYFYPMDDTPGCTTEACAFRDHFQQFLDQDVMVFGISADSVEKHRNFAAKYQLTFDLLSDPDNKIRKMFGVPRSMWGLLPGRVTYVFNKSGECVHVFSSQLYVKQHVVEALSALR
jgi:peroxiredoxin Q/BCP